MAQYFKEQGLLGASFFFKRGAGDRSNARRFFATIARQLAAAGRYPMLKELIAKAVRAEPDLADKALRVQFEKFILQPLSSVQVDSRMPSIILLVIDALDECEREEDIRVIIQLFRLCKDTKPVRLRVLVMSRPELPIVLGFEGLPGGEYDDFVLHNIPASVIEHDIKLFIQSRFRDIRLQHKIAATWPEEAVITQLTILAIPLFIFAATVCRYVEDSGRSPRKQLDYFLQSIAKSQASGMGQTYLPILERLIIEKNEEDREIILQNFNETVGAIVLLATPLSTKELARLLELDKDEVVFRLRHLHSVLDVPLDESLPIRTFHLSFRDFLVGSERGLREGDPFWIDEGEAHKRLAHHCLRLLNTSDCLKQDICDVKLPWTRKADIDQKDIEKALPPEIQYACRYWVRHAKASTTSAKNDTLNIDLIFSFLQRRFLFWLEALSLSGHTKESIGMMDMLLSIPAIKHRQDLTSFIFDAQRLILHSRLGFEETPLQLYSSALIFAPEHSIVRKTFREFIPLWIRLLPQIQSDWSPCLQSLVGHSKVITSMAFSTDGMLASGSHDNTVKLWDPTTGELHDTFIGHSEGVPALAFSPDGRKLVSGSWDETLKTWDVATGAFHTLNNRGAVRGVAFSPDGHTVASASDRNGIKLWDTVTGISVSLEGTQRETFAVSFSPDGHTVAGGEPTINLWDTATGELLSKFEEDRMERLNAVVFSPDGHVLAAAYDNGVKLWDVATRKLRSRLEDFTESYAVAFSSDGQTVASGYLNDGIGGTKLWDVATGTLCRTLVHGHDIYAVAFVPHGHIFSPEGLLIASGSADNMVKLWDTTSPLKIAPRRTSEEHFVLRNLQFSLDGQRVVSYGRSPDDFYFESLGVRQLNIWDTTSGAILKSFPFYEMDKSPEGCFVVEGMEFHSSETEHPRSEVGTNGPWITWTGRNLLWVPPEHRNRTRVTPTFGSKIALGLEADVVSFLDFDSTILAELERPRAD